jgi:putative ABC transport system substrate-binding protein
MKPPHALGRRATVRFCGGMAAALAAGRVHAAIPNGPFRVGIVSVSLERTSAQFVALDTALREYGFRDNLTIELIRIDSIAEYEESMRALVRDGVDVIIGNGSEAALRAARQATTTIPIVTLAFDFDPVAAGLVASLARSGNNITGINVEQPQLAAKRAALLLQTAPGIRRVFVREDPTSANQTPGAVSALKAAGIEAHVIALDASPYDYEAALKDADGANGDALLVMASNSLFIDCDAIADVALRRRLPSSVAFSEFPTRGGLMSYGVDTVEMYRLAADYVARLLEGAHPTDLPLQQPVKFELVINLKTASALGLTIPRSLLFLADDVIQ